MEAVSKLEDFTSNPVETGRAWGARVGLDLQFHMRVGKGVDSVAPTDLVATRVVAFHRLRTPHRRWGTKSEEAPCQLPQGHVGHLDTAPRCPEVLPHNLHQLGCGLLRLEGGWQGCSWWSFMRINGEDKG